MSLYESIKKDPNNFSYWFPKVEHCGMKVPKSVVVQIPEDVWKCFYMERADDADNIAIWVKTAVMPAISEMPTLLFVKNGGFSNKFDFRTCALRKDYYELVPNMIMINYQSMTFETGGDTEFVFRERLGWQDEYDQYHIYSGMPLRPEFRVFYDFDRRKVLYSVNYWDWDYCHDGIGGDKTDKLAYEAAYPELDRFFKENQEKVERLVEEHMRDVDLTGIWSVDIMWCDNDFWLIDMALGITSAYYDPEKCNLETV